MRDLISPKIVSTSSSCSANHAVGVGVLGLEVGDRVGVVAVAQPRPRVVDAAGGAIPVMFDLFGDGFVHGRHRVIRAPAAAFADLRRV